MVKKVLSAKDIFSKSDFLDRFKNNKNYIHEEFQDFGFRLAVKLDDMAHKALYIKIARDLPRSIVEETMEFTLDYPLKTGKRAKIFMWRLFQLCKEKEIFFSFRKSPKKTVKKVKPQMTLFANDDSKKVVKKKKTITKSS